PPVGCAGEPRALHQWPAPRCDAAPRLSLYMCDLDPAGPRCGRVRLSTVELSPKSLDRLLGAANATLREPQRRHIGRLSRRHIGKFGTEAEGDQRAANAVGRAGALKIWRSLPRSPLPSGRVACRAFGCAYVLAGMFALQGRTIAGKPYPAGTFNVWARSGI